MSGYRYVQIRGNQSRSPLNATILTPARLVIDAEFPLEIVASEGLDVCLRFLSCVYRTSINYFPETISFYPADTFIRYPVQLVSYGLTHPFG